MILTVSWNNTAPGPSSFLFLLPPEEHAPMSHAMTSGPASLLLLLSLLAVASASAAEMKPLAKGDRIVFLGDSITQGGAGPNG